MAPLPPFFSKNERIIIIVGSSVPSVDESIILFNCNTNEWIVKENILPFECEFGPSIIVHNDHIHVMSKQDHFSIYLRILLNEFGGYKDINTYLFWEQVRLRFIKIEIIKNAFLVKLECQKIC